MSANPSAPDGDELVVLGLEALDVPEAEMRKRSLQAIDLRVSSPGVGASGRLRAHWWFVPTSR